MHDVRLLTTAEIPAAELAASRRLMDAAFDDFTDDDWAHALGGWHAFLGNADDVVAHAAVVPRPIVIGAREFSAGYVEAVAVRPDLQGTGLGSRVMAAINDVVRARFDLGVLSTGEWHFYERLGWERWRGPAFVRGGDGRLTRAEEEDDGVMVLRCVASAAVDPTAPIACDERDGDSW
jgi:aminoglycoside 2'-N-acetyltransferase I